VFRKIFVYKPEGITEEWRRLYLIIVLLLNEEECYRGDITHMGDVKEIQKFGRRCFMEE
jgi:hypothetical protein